MKEKELLRSELEPLAHSLSSLFIQRHDLYARQLDGGRYICVQKPLRTSHLIAHLRGDITLGAYVLNPESRASYIVFDADDDGQWKRLAVMASRLANQGATAYMEQSRRGGHLWLFLAQPVAGSVAREFGRGLVSAFGLDGIELFPKQDYLADGPGSLVRLPFGVHRKDGQRYGFVTPDGTPLAETITEQIRLLSNPQRVPEAVFDAYRQLQAATRPPVQKTEIEATPAANGALSQRIKDSVSVLDFVSQYVELSSQGRGLCPFHDDKHASFSVNAEKNYWHCFAGCGGGSLIDFWMKYQDCDFTTAVRELAEMLL